MPFPRISLPEPCRVADPDPCCPVFFAASAGGVRRPALARWAGAFATHSLSFGLIAGQWRRCFTHRGGVFSGGRQRGAGGESDCERSPEHSTGRLFDHIARRGQALMDAKKRGVDVRVLIDDRGNRSAASQSAQRLITGPGIPLRVLSVYAIHHNKYLVVDGATTQTGSFNYS